MRATMIRSFGGPQALELLEVPAPHPGAGQVRVKVTAATVNPVDLATRSGLLAQWGVIPPRELIGVGHDVAGVVDMVGAGVTDFGVGDAVIGLTARLGAPLGTYADYAVLNAADITAAPKTVSAVEAATIPLNGLTALRMLDALGLEPGQRLLVTGAAGAVGGYAVELAAGQGIEVLAVGGATDADLLRTLGARHVIPRDTDLAEQVRRVHPTGVDGVVDAAVLGISAVDALRDGGAYAGVGMDAPAPVRGISVENIWVAADGTKLASLVALVDSGRLRMRVADVYPLDRAAAAHTRLADGGVRGRLVLRP